jgi:hypothetical protein
MDNDVQNPAPVVSGYKAVSRTFAYGILYAALPLLFAYEIGLPSINAGKMEWEINGIDGIFQKAVTLFGVIPQDFAIPLLVAALIIGSFLAVRYEQKKYGTIDIQGIFFVLTLKEAFLLSLLVNPIVAFLSSGYLAIPFIHGLSALPACHEFFLQATSAAGAGFFEELFCRVILLGVIMQFLKRAVQLPFTAQVIGVAVSALIFAAIHYTGILGIVAEDFSPQSFLYRFLLGIIYGTLYLRSGFATTAWTHAFANLWVSAGIF